MFGLQFSAQAHALTFAPHIPANWKEFSIRNLAAGAETVDLRFSRSSDSMVLVAERKGDTEVRMAFHPAVSPRAEMLGATLNGRNVPFHLEAHDNDQHVIVDVNLAAGTNSLKIRLRNDFAITYAGHLPALGNTSQGLRIVSEAWTASRDSLTLEMQGIAGKTYALSVWGKDQIKSVDGARFAEGDSIEVNFAPNNSAEDTQKQTLTIHFTGQAKKSSARSKSNN
jgi:hypothetical protein